MRSTARGGGRRLRKRCGHMSRREHPGWVSLVSSVGQFVGSFDRRGSLLSNRGIPRRAIHGLKKENPLRKSVLAGAVLFACVLTASHASAIISLHPSACVLIQNVAPWGAVTGATYSNATFTNSSGVTRRTICPLPFTNDANDFQVSTTSGVNSCILKTMSNQGGATVHTGTRSGNTWTFSTTLNGGEYGAEIECILPNGTGLFHMLNF